MTRDRILDGFWNWAAEYPRRMAAALLPVVAALAYALFSWVLS